MYEDDRPLTPVKKKQSVLVYALNSLFVVALSAAAVVLMGRAQSPGDRAESAEVSPEPTPAVQQVTAAPVD